MPVVFMTSTMTLMLILTASRCLLPKPLNDRVTPMSDTATLLTFKLVTVAITIMTATSVLGQIDPAERTALEALFNTTGGPYWTSNTSWLSTTVDACNWMGVDCSSSVPSHVTCVL
jgi:hypothetical protein